jgi:hypothetical protein
MPLTPSTLAAPILLNLVGTAHLGIATPVLALGVATGITLWMPTVQVISVDTGTLGVGAGVVPILIVPSVLITNLTIGFKTFGLLGGMAPLTITGLGLGISTGMLLGLATTIHPTVGLGAGVCTFRAPPAAPMMIAGMTNAGMTGPSVAQLGSAIGMALDLTFATLVLPTPIVGPPSILPGAGAGTGTIV